LAASGGMSGAHGARGVDCGVFAVAAHTTDIHTHTVDVKPPEVCMAPYTGVTDTQAVLLRGGMHTC
jgi:hypothetical protein